MQSDWMAQFHATAQADEASDTREFKITIYGER